MNAFKIEKVFYNWTFNPIQYNANIYKATYFLIFFLSNLFLMALHFTTLQHSTDIATEILDYYSYLYLKTHA